MAIDFLRLLQALANTGAEFVIVGGVAARLHGSTRLTHDVDIVPDLESGSWAGLIDTLWDHGGRPRIPETRDAIRDVDNVARWIAEKGMLALSFHSADGLAEVDLLVAEASRFQELRARALSVVLDGVTYWVASLPDLIAMKRAAGRPQDLLDIEELERLAERIRKE